LFSLAALQLLEEVLVEAVERDGRLLLYADSVADHQLSEPLSVDELEAGWSCSESP
jgi:hypothetical protein